MNRKIAVLIVFVLLLVNISVTMANVRAQINWKGELKINGFSSLPGNPGNSDAESSPMTYEWTIDDGSSHTIDKSVCDAPIVNGSVLLVEALGPGQDEPLDVNGFVNVATLLPAGIFSFPPGVIPLFETFGPPTPISTIVLKETAIDLDSELDVNQVTFDGNVLTFQVNENVLSGTAASALFNAEDATPPNNGDGILTRPFIVDVTLDCGDDFIGENEDVTTDTLEEGGFTITNRRFEDSTIFAPGTIIRVEQNPDGSLTLIIAREPGLGPDPAKPIPSLSTFGLLLLSPLLGLVAMFRKKQK
jgi:hypothetical protein